MHEAHTLAGHGIFIAAAEDERRCGDLRGDRRLDGHETVIAVDDHPRPLGPGESGQLGNPVKHAAAVEQQLADEDQVELSRSGNVHEAGG